MHLDEVIGFAPTEKYNINVTITKFSNNKITSEIDCRYHIYL